MHNWRHIEKTANAVTSFKNTKQFQNQEIIYWHAYSFALKIFGFYQVINFWCFKIVSRYIPRKPFILRNPSKLRCLCQIKRPLHIIYSHGVNSYFDMIFRIVIYSTFAVYVDLWSRTNFQNRRKLLNLNLFSFSFLKSYMHYSHMSTLKVSGAFQ